MMAWARVVAGLGLGLLLLTACGTDPAAVVNGEVITRAEFEHELRAVMDFYSTTQGINWTGDPRAQAELPRLRALVLGNLIDTRLLRQQATLAGVVVSDRDVEARMGEVQAEAGGRDQLIGLLQERGLTALAFRQTIQDTVMREELTRRRMPAVAAEIEVRRVRHVLVDTADKAAAARQRLAAGESWEAIAAAVSLDPATRGRGGDLGFLERGQTVPSFDQAAFTLAVKELSAPVQTPFGYHILMVEEARTQRPTAEQLVEMRQQFFGQFLQSVRAQASIQTFVDAPGLIQP
jgi:peptidyl-prolyl cis-trans isomerase C